MTSINIVRLLSIYKPCVSGTICVEEQCFTFDFDEMTKKMWGRGGSQDNNELIIIARLGIPYGWVEIAEAGYGYWERGIMSGEDIGILAQG